MAPSSKAYSGWSNSTSGSVTGTRRSTRWSCKKRSPLWKADTDSSGCCAASASNNSGSGHWFAPAARRRSRCANASSAHGTARPSYIHRSEKPYSIDRFELIQKTNFSYTQPWHLPGRGFLFLHTRYAEGRGLHWMTSDDGRTWGKPQPLARIAMGDFQVSWRHGARVGTQNIVEQIDLFVFT